MNLDKFNLPLKSCLKAFCGSIAIVSVTNQVGLSHTLSETSKTGFRSMRPKYGNINDT